jgi:hypothetical protein
VAEWFFAGFARVTGTEIAEEDRKEVYDVRIPVYTDLFDLILTGTSS